MAETWNDIILQAYVEVNVIQDTSETISTTLRDNAFLLLQQLFSAYSADRLLAYLTVHQTFSLVAGTVAYTVGTGGTLTTSARPVAITSWKSVSAPFSTGGDPVSFDELRQKQQNADGRSSVLVEMLAADQGFPSINIEVYPPPASSPGSLVLDYFTPLVQPAAVGDSITLPDGYGQLSRLGLATMLEPRYPMADGPRAELTRNYASTLAEIKGRVAAILSGPPPVAGA